MHQGLTIILVKNCKAFEAAEFLGNFTKPMLIHPAQRFTTAFITPSPTDAVFCDENAKDDVSWARTAVRPQLKQSLANHWRKDWGRLA